MTRPSKVIDKKEGKAKTDPERAALMFKQHQSGMSDGDIAAKHGMARSSVNRILKPFKEQAAILAMEELGTDIKLLAAKWVKDCETDAAILEQLKNDALIALKDKDNKDIDSKKALIADLKDTIYRLGSNRIALVMALKPLGLTAEAGPLSGKYTPQGQLFQFFIKELNVIGGDVDKALVEKVGKMQEYLKNKESGKKAIEADFEVEDG